MLDLTSAVSIPRDNKQKQILCLCFVICVTIHWSGLCLQILHTLFQWLCLLAIKSLFCRNCFSVWFQVTGVIALKISHFKPWWHCSMKCCGYYSRTDLYIIKCSTKWRASQDGRWSSFNLRVNFYLTIIKNYFHF
jgi:hypothetical protein